MLICVVYFTRYLEEFEKKIPRAEMLELQVFHYFYFYSFNYKHFVVISLHLSYWLVAHFVAVVSITVE